VGCLGRLRRAERRIAPGMEAEASRIFRNRSSAPGWPLAAIAPIFQMIGRC
jgi:hypothetical protein